MDKLALYNLKRMFLGDVADLKQIDIQYDRLLMEKMEVEEKRNALLDKLYRLETQSRENRNEMVRLDTLRQEIYSKFKRNGYQGEI